jgi:hypothetical protein
MIPQITCDTCNHRNDCPLLQFSMERRKVFCSLIGRHQKFLSYDELCEMAFSINTPDELALNYQKQLKDTKKQAKKYKTTVDEVIFCRSIISDDDVLVFSFKKWF